MIWTEAEMYFPCINIKYWGGQDLLGGELFMFIGNTNGNETVKQSKL